MASSESEKWAVVEYGHHGPSTKVYRFQILLPNGTSTSLTLCDPGEEMPLPDFLHIIREELGDALAQGGQRRGIEWDGDVYLEDLLDRKIDKKVQFSDFVTKGTNILRLQDGEEFVRTYENMWDLTPPTELLQELPAEYSTESALADLVDNSLQALWSNGDKQRKLIRITVDGGKIVVFDTGRGMDGSEENSISKWGTMGSSNHRVFRKQGIGGKAPYLVPFFGMFGYGGTIASMHLGRTAIVSSKTKESRKVFTLHLSREALLEKSSSKLSWKTAGGVRDPSEEELALSPHRSFTQVEIHGLNRHLEPGKLQGFLKDIYFPYIQDRVRNDDIRERLAVAPIEEKLVQHRLRWFGHIQRRPSEAPVHSGRIKRAENVKRGRGRPNLTWEESVKRPEGLEYRQRLSHGQWCVEVSYPRSRAMTWFRDLMGFNSSLPQLTDLAQHDIFTQALRCFDGSCRNDSSVEEVSVDARKDERSLNRTQLEKQYHDWINTMHAKYDVEMDGGDDEHTVIINPSNKERLGISKDVQVIRVHTSVRRKGKTWRRGDHLKIQPGVVARTKNNFYSSKSIFYGTLEYVVVEGLQGDICGEARLICRSIECSGDQGCLLEVGQDSMHLNIKESFSFPVSMIDENKCQTMEEDSWCQMLKKKSGKAPACIEVLRNLQGNALAVDGVSKVIMAGYNHPREVIAVIRPQNATTCSTSLLDKRYILKDDDLEMALEINHLSGSKDHLHAKLIYKKLKKPSSRNSINGLYIFQLSEERSMFTKSGVYSIIFSVRCRDSTVIKHEAKITVSPNSNTRHWQLSCDADWSAENAVVDIRLGMPVQCLAARSLDLYGNGIPFLDIDKAVITILGGDDILANVKDIKVDLSTDLLTLYIRDFLVKTNILDRLRPSYEAMLKISLSDSEFSHPCKVKPGIPSAINMDMSLAWEKNLTPGEVIDDALLEVLDHCGNHVEEGTELRIHTVGLSFVDKYGPVRKVNSEGFVDLRGLFKVVSGFGSKVSLTILHNKKKIFNRSFQIAIRNLKAVKVVPESCRAGTFLENIIFEVSDCDGVIDESIHGPQHTLSIRSNQLKHVEGAQYTFEHGRCVLPHAQVPDEPGTVSFVAYHTHFADLETIIQVPILQYSPVHALDLVPVNLENDFEPICSYPTSSVSNQDLLPPSQPASCQSVRFIEVAMKKVSDEIETIDSNIHSKEEFIKFLDSQKKSVANRIATLKDEIGHRIGEKELTRHKIEENVGTAAAVLCNLTNRKRYEPGRCFKDEVVGIVALLGTVNNRELSRMLSVYLGEDNMLAVVCKTLDAANYFEKYDTDGNVDIHFGIHQEAANLGVPISRRFPIICLDEIRPYNGSLVWNTRQKKLNLPSPHSETCKGFRGFAVNLINLSAENLEITTSRGHGLRETLLYRLFGELQVYETRNDMRQAMPHLRNGAISLDGGIIKGDGMLLLGYSDPEITFPVMPDAPDILEDSEDVFFKVKKMNAEKNVLETVENKIRKAEEKRQKLVMKRNKKKRKFDEMAGVMS
ncbi:hypothetical protein D1007_54495 [Hordeum vulgare]|nr:hypothetical protein D1007_54495 [Hordeum vulgare]